MLPSSPAESIWVFGRKRDTISREITLRYIAYGMQQVSSSRVRGKLRVFNQYYIFVETHGFTASFYALVGRAGGMWGRENTGPKRFSPPALGTAADRSQMAAAVVAWRSYPLIECRRHRYSVSRTGTDKTCVSGGNRST